MDQPGPSWANGDSEDDDPIVDEIPIVHSKILEDELHLLNFSYEKLEKSDCETVRTCLYKPHNRKLKLEVDIDVSSPSFNLGKAKDIAEEINSCSKDKAVPFENKLVDKVVLNSIDLEPNNNFAVAAFNGKEIHLTSIKDVFDLQQCFNHFENLRSHKKKKARENSDSEEDEETVGKPGTSNVQQVTVKIKKPSDDDKELKEKFYKDLQMEQDRERWTACTWYDEKSTKSEVRKLDLISNCTYDRGQPDSLSEDDYARIIVPEHVIETPLEPKLPSHVLSLGALQGLPLQEQCKSLLKNAHIMQFQQIMLLLAGIEGANMDSVIKVLQNVAVLVRGNWIVKSEVNYPKDSFSPISGVPAEVMCRARDYILYLFTKHQYVERKKVSSELKIPAEDVKDILAGISKLRSENKGWELCLPPDNDFLAKHPDIAQRQNLFWEHRFNQIRNFLVQPNHQRRKSKSASESESVTGKPRNNSISCSDTDSGTESKGKTPIGPSKKGKYH